MLIILMEPCERSTCIMKNRNILLHSEIILQPAKCLIHSFLIDHVLENICLFLLFLMNCYRYYFIIHWINIPLLSTSNISTHIIFKWVTSHINTTIPQFRYSLFETWTTHSMLDFTLYKSRTHSNTTVFLSRQ